MRRRSSASNPLPAELARIVVTPFWPPTMLQLVYGAIIAGYVELSWSGADQISDFGIMVEPAYRGQGLGSTLLRALIDFARAHQVRRISGYVRHEDLERHPFLLTWYRRYGFQVVPSPSVATAAFLLLELPSTSQDG